MDTEQIIKALMTIHEACEIYSNENGKCITCPMGSANGDCRVIDCPPDEWDINDRSIWRAFL